MTGSAFEIAGSGADQDLVFSDDTLAAAPADTAVGIHHNRAGFHKDIKQSLLQRIQINLSTGRNDQKTHQGMHLTSPEQFSANPEILQTAVVAGA